MKYNKEKITIENIKSIIEANRMDKAKKTVVGE